MSDSSQSEFAASVIGVKRIPTSMLFPNPHNPRVLFDRQPLAVLKDSIRRVGILVPLTVYWETKRERFVILDGQRRWICAKGIGLTDVPVNQVAEPTLIQNLVTMFQIHKLREDWELMPTALKLELLMKEVGDRNEARLAELTGLDQAVIVRCKKLISYEKEFQDLMLDPDPEKRTKADFFIEMYAVLLDRDIRKFDWFNRRQFIEQMLAKYTQEPQTIRAVTDFRRIKQYISNARKADALGPFSQRLREFVESRDRELSYLEIPEASVRAEANAIVKRITGLQEALDSLDAEQFYGEEDLWACLERLLQTLQMKLEQANKRR